MKKSVNHKAWFARLCENDMLSAQKCSGWGECFSLYTESRLL